jgi:formylmethanofuran dehydrogenase subunit E
MPWTDDPIADFEQWDREQNRQLEALPVCADCDEHIQDESAFYINGEWICENCMDAYRREVLPE